MATGYDDLFAVKLPGSITAFFSTDYGTVTTLAPAATWGAGFTQEVSGLFARTFFNSGTQLLLYNGTAGTGTFCDVTNGQISEFHVQSDWQKTWTHIVPGLFRGTSGSEFSDILFYDAAAGHAEFYSINDNGSLELLSQHDGWQKTWTHIISGNFGSGVNGGDLLFYDAAAGAIEIYSTANGALSKSLSSNNHWRTGWSQIIPGNFNGSTTTDLFFHDAAGRTGQFYSVTKGSLSLLNSVTDRSEGWSYVIPGQFGGTASTDLMFYDSSSGDNAIYTVDRATLTLIGSKSSWSSGWTQIFAGYYSSPFAQPSVPVPPSELRVTNIGSNSVDLAWIQNSINANGFTISYHGARSEFSDHNGTFSPAADARTATLTGLRSGYEYSISMVAFNDVGNSGSSNTVMAAPIPRIIAISRQGFGASTVFMVTGTGFTPESYITVQITAPISDYKQQQFTETAGVDGRLNASVNAPCNTGEVQTILAFEQTNEVETTSNWIEITC